MLTSPSRQGAVLHTATEMTSSPPTVRPSRGLFACGFPSSSAEAGEKCPGGELVVDREDPPRGEAGADELIRARSHGCWKNRDSAPKVVRLLRRSKEQKEAACWLLMRWCAVALRTGS